MKHNDLRDIVGSDYKGDAKAAWAAKPILQVTPEWGNKLTAGAKLALLGVVLGMAHSAAFNLLPATRWALLLGVIPAMAVIYAISGWLISTPDPRDASWLAKPRWAIRVAIVINLASTGLRLIFMGLLKWDVVAESHIVLAHGIVGVLGTAGMAGSFWYDRELTGALKDRLLRKISSIFMWLALLFVPVLVALLFSSDPRTKAVPGLLRPSNVRQPKWVMALVIMAVLGAIGMLLTVRFLRLVTRARDAAIAEAQSPQPAPPPLPDLPENDTDE